MSHLRLLTTGLLAMAALYGVPSAVQATDGDGRQASAAIDVIGCTGEGSPELLGAFAWCSDELHEQVTRPSPTNARHLDAACAPVPVADDQCEEWTAVHDPAGAALTMGVTAAGCGAAAAPQCGRVFTAGWEEVGGVSAYSVVAQDALSGTALWTAIYRSGAWDELYDVGVSPDGTRVFVTGRCCGSPTGGWQFTTVALDAATGERLWAERYDGEDPAVTDLALSLDVSPDGSRVYVTGVSGRDARTIAYDAANGDEAWHASYAGPAGGVDQGFEVVASPDGERVFVGGASASRADNTNYDYLVLAYAARTRSGVTEGDLLWVTRLDNVGGSDVAQTLAVSHDGTRVVASGIARSVGLTTGGLYANHEFLTAGVDAWTGEVKWTSRYSGGAGGLNGANDVVIAPDGKRVYVTGTSTSEANAVDIDMVTLAYDAATGEEEWIARLETPGHWVELGNRVGVSPDSSRVFASGSSLAVQANSVLRADTVTQAYDAGTGDQVWAARHNSSPAAIDTSFAGYLAVAPDGQQVFTAGMTLVKGFGGVFATMSYPAKGLLEDIPPRGES